MHEYNSDTHRVVVRGDGVIEAWALAPPVLRETRSTPDGGLSFSILTKETASAADRALLVAKEKMPLFRATYLKPGWYNCDIDAGMQRWRGLKPTRHLSKALRASPLLRHLPHLFSSALSSRSRHFRHRTCTIKSG